MLKKQKQAKQSKEVKQSNTASVISNITTTTNQSSKANNVKKSKLKKLGEGSFGCVVSHPLKCSEPEEFITKKDSKSKDQKEVGKLFYDKEDFKEEVKLSKLVQKIDPSEKKLLVPISACGVSKQILEDKENINAIMKCERITRSDEYKYYNTNTATIPKKVWQIKMPYAGMEIDKAVEKYKFGITPKILMSMVEPLFEALILLKNNNTVHQDIKISNILVYKKKAILIDFSLMMPTKNIYSTKNYYRLKRKYRPYPPEYHLVSLVMKYQHEIKTMDKTLKDIIEKQEYHIDKIAYYFTPFYTKEELLENGGLDTLLPMVINNIDSMTEYADKIDLFSIGTVLAELSLLYMRKPTSNPDYVQLMRGILHPDPRKRFSCENAYELCKKISKS